MRQSDRDRWKSVGLALFVVFLWATSWVLIKVGLEEIPALTFAGLRYSLAFLFLLPVIILSKNFSRIRDLPRPVLAKLVGLGLLLYAVTQGAQFVALAYLPAVTTNLVWSFSPLAVALLGFRYLQERPTIMQAVGIVLALGGAIVFFYPADLPASSQIGLLVALIGVFANAGASVLGRDLNRSLDLSPITVTVVSMGIGSLTLLAAGIGFQGLPDIGRQGWMIVGWLALVNTAFAFAVWNFTLQRLTATESSVINGTMLIWIPILAVLFLGERLTSREVFGLVIAGIGTLAVQLKLPGRWTEVLGRARS